MKDKVLLERGTTSKGNYEVVRTGEYVARKYLFKVLTVPEQLEGSDELEKLKKQLKPDFITVEKKGYLSFRHTTSLDNQSIIEQNGLKVSSENHDLGIGIYVVDKSDVTGIMNLEDYVQETYEDEFLMVEGEYEGAYQICIYGYGHEGYIVLPSDIKREDIIDVYVTTVEEFVSN